MVLTNMAHSSNRVNISTLHRCPEAVLKAVPSRYKTVLFSELDTDENNADKAIIGRVTNLYPIGKRANGSTRKLLIADAISPNPEDQQKYLPVFLLNSFAEESAAAEIEGYIILANFQLENSTRHKENEWPLQILVKNEDAKVLFGRKVPPSASTSTNVKKKTVPTKKKNVLVNEEPPIVLANTYEYIPIGDLEETEAKMSFNVFGIVEKCDLKVIQGKRTTILDVVLTDETDSGFICSIFGAKDEIFPDIYPGDIVRVHRMQVYKFRSRLKGRCPSPKFLLVFSKSNHGTRPKSVAKSFTFVDEDATRVKELFEWNNKNSESKLISEMRRGDYVNIVCQVIGVYCAKHTEAVIVKIWDGTKTNQLESTHWGLKQEVLDEKLFMVAKNYYVVLHVYGPYASSAAELRPGQFIEVRDAHLNSPRTNPDDYKLCVQTGKKEGSGIAVLSDEDGRVKNLKTRLERITADILDIGNNTDDILSRDNSIFLNCDISQCTSSQRPLQNENRNDDNEIDMETANTPSSTTNDPVASENVADIEALNSAFRTNVAGSTRSQNTVVSVLEVAVKPGQCTQEFGGIQRELQDMDTDENEIASQINPPLNKTALEFRNFLHNPPTQESPSFLPVSSETDKDWWKSVPTISETIGHSTIKPSTFSEIAQHSVPYKFRSLVVVLSYNPNAMSVAELIHLHCPQCWYTTKAVMPSINPYVQRDGLFYYHCPDCSLKQTDMTQWPVLKYIFILSFELQDFTGSQGLEAHLWQDNAVQLLKGVTPEQVLTDPAAADAVQQMLWNVCPNCRPYNSKEMSEHYTSYPVLDCCLFSYPSRRGTVYQMFDTRLL